MRRGRKEDVRQALNKRTERERARAKLCGGDYGGMSREKEGVSGGRKVREGKVHCYLRSYL